MKKIVKYVSIIIFIMFFITLTNIIYAKNTYPKKIQNIQKIEFLDDEDKIITTYINSVEKNWENINDINSIFLDDLLFIEDKDFYKHSGFNSLRIFRVFFNNLVKKKVEGASTITQQYARNLFLTNKKSYSRKIQELYFSIILENTYSKDEILEGYLNTIYFGDGKYGIGDACFYYFNKNVSNITKEESIILISLLQNPSLSTNIEKLKERCFIISKILNYNFDYDFNFSYNEKTKEDHYRYYIDFILNKLKYLNIVNKKAVYNLKIKTNLNINLSKYSYDLINNSNSNAETSLVAIEPFSGKVKAIIGGKDYNLSSYNRAIASKRQIGSTVKAFNYYNAINHGFDPTTSFTSEKTVFNGLSIKNFNDKYENDKISLTYASATSDNIYSVKTHLFLGTNKLVNTLKSLNFNNLNEDIYLALGNNEANLLTLTNGYNVLASLGKNSKPIFVNEIYLDGNLYYKNSTIQKQLLNYTSSFLTSELLTNTFDTNLSHNINVTGTSISNKLTNKYAGKSGLTDYDSYFVGYNKLITIGVWTGYDDNEYLMEYNDLVNSKNIWFNSIEYYLKNKIVTWYDIPNDVYLKTVNPSGLNTIYKKELYFRK